MTGIDIAIVLLVLSSLIQDYEIYKLNKDIKELKK